MGLTPSQSVDSNAGSGISAALGGLDGVLVEELWQESEAANCGLILAEFTEILLGVGTAQNYGLSPGTVATRQQQGAFFRGLKLADLVLAQACSRGNERAWERLFALYRQTLIRAAVAITGNDTLGRTRPWTLPASVTSTSPLLMPSSSVMKGVSPGDLLLARTTGNSRRLPLSMGASTRYGPCAGSTGPPAAAFTLLP